MLTYLHTLTRTIFHRDTRRDSSQTNPILERSSHAAVPTNGPTLSTNRQDAQQRERIKIIMHNSHPRPANTPTTTDRTGASQEAEIRCFFDKTNPDTRQQFAAIDTAFLERCTLPPSAMISTENAALILETTEKVCFYFVEQYSSAVEKHLYQKWCTSRQNTTAPDTLAFFKEELLPQLAQATPQNPWACLYIHALFNVINKHSDIPEPQRQSIHEHLLTQTWTGVLQSLSSHHPLPAHIRQTLHLPEQRPRLVHVLHTFIFEYTNKASSKKTELQEDFKRTLFYRFLETLFKIKQEEFFNFEGFDFCKK